MLRMKCQSCGRLIESPLLAEVELFVCPQCKEIVVVNDVVIAEQKASSPLRSCLKSLLSSAKEKFQRNRSKDLDAQTRLVVNKRLALLLKRDDFRLNLFYDLLVNVIIDNAKTSAKLLNMSSSGAAVEFFASGEPPAAGTEVTLQLLLPGQAQPLTLSARVVWSRRTADAAPAATVIMGMQFTAVEEQTRLRLWDFIVDAETAEHA
jgi:predicted RNA-binding Zn-ribbon protein involved in translation (DUF1610 family)/Tfp pilus assembly protein PilZ